MDTADPQIVFDDGGFCNHCNDYIATHLSPDAGEVDAERELSRMIDRVKLLGRGNTYDCILGMSGGVDSSYAANMIKDMGLRPLAVHMDNGWDSEEAVSNVRKIVTKLDIDYQSYVLDWEDFKDLQLAFLKASVPEAETPTDVAISGALHHYAGKYGIKHIISAGNITTEGILPKSWHYNSKDRKYMDHIHKTFGKTKLGSFPTFDYKQEMYFKLVRGIRVVYPINYVKFEQKEAVDLLTNKFGYVAPKEKHHESRYTRFIQSYYLFEKFGIDYRRARFSSEICSAQMTREEALEKIKPLPYDPADIASEKVYIAKKLSVSLDEFESILALPPKWYWDYPNDQKKLEFIYGIYRRINGKQ